MSRYFNEDEYSEEELDQLYAEREQLKLDNALDYMAYQAEQEANAFWETL